AGLDGGRYVGVDRSEKATTAAEARNAASVESGLARFVTASLDGFDARGETFDRVLAVNVNVFWTTAAGPELAAVARLLAPGGRVVLCFEPPDGRRRAALARRLGENLSAAGFDSVQIPCGDTLLVVRAALRP
ncbi:MAG TPA: methyltransferase domain-containing protein, partial [Phytomonospora sp.]